MPREFVGVVGSVIAGGLRSLSAGKIGRGGRSRGIVRRWGTVDSHATFVRRVAVRRRDEVSVAPEILTQPFPSNMAKRP